MCRRVLVGNAEHTPTRVGAHNRADLRESDLAVMDVSKHSAQVLSVWGLAVHHREMVYGRSPADMVAQPSQRLAARF